MHHAYLYRHEADFSPENFSDFFPAEFSVTTKRFLSIGIDEVRDIIREVMLTPNGNLNNHVIILEADHLTHEAEQAMLKVFEDLRPGVTLVLKLPPGYQLIGTLKSRFFELGQASELEVNFEFTNFLSLTYSERLATIADHTANKNTAWITAMKKGLSAWLIKTAPQNNLSAYELIISNLNQRGAANKMLLEELALRLPKR